jgi:hypothetical protein
LLKYHQGRAKGPAVKIPAPLREEMVRVLLGAIRKSGHRVLVIAVKGKHAHALVELPRDSAETRQVVGKWKCARSKLVRARLKGSIWGEGGKYKPVRSRAHQRSAFKYIRDEQGPGARVWTYRDGFLPATQRPKV